MGKHTPGQLTYEIVPSDQRERAQPYTEWTGLFIGLDDEEGGTSHTLFEGGFTHGPKDGDPEADAQRLIACWNACAGIPTEQLVDGRVELLVEGLRYARRFLSEEHHDLEYVDAILKPFQKESD